MIRGFHSIFTAYGFWLPNDPRGSWSDYVRKWELLRFGEIVPARTRRSVAQRDHNAERRLAAKKVLEHQPVRFDGAQALEISRGFAQALREGGYVLHACAILPDHVHLVVAWHHRPIRRIIGHLKARATQRLYALGTHPMQHHPDRPSMWALNSWNVYLNDDADVRRAIAYVERNPLREGVREQRWSFVTRYG